jgi:hypothetical protein
MKRGAKELFDEWSIYDKVLDHDYIVHDEMFNAVQRLLAQRYDDVLRTNEGIKI